MTAPCQATLLAGQGHGGDVAAYVRLCPRGHTRTGWACETCAGNGAILCQECPEGQNPAVLVRAEVFTALPVGEIRAELQVMTGARAGQAGERPVLGQQEASDG